jgi:hypothetical protein
MEDIRIVIWDTYMRGIGPKVYAMAKENRFTQTETSLRASSCMEPNLDMVSIPFQTEKYMKAVFTTIKVMGLEK